MNKVLLITSKNKISDKRVSQKTKNKYYSFDENIYFFIKISSFFYNSSLNIKKFLIVSLTDLRSSLKNSKLTSAWTSEAECVFTSTQFFVSIKNKIEKKLGFFVSEINLIKALTLSESQVNKIWFLVSPKYIYE
jgi:hypothetical protein